MRVYSVFEGYSENDNSLVTDFRSRDKALDYAESSDYDYVLVNEYEGTKDDPWAWYVASIYEKSI